MTDDDKKKDDEGYPKLPSAVEPGLVRMDTGKPAKGMRVAAEAPGDKTALTDLRTSREPEAIPPDVAVGPETPPPAAAPALPGSVLGTEVPPGQEIPTQKMGQAEHLAENPKAEEEFRAHQDRQNTLRNFGEKEAALRGSMVGLDWRDPDYTKKIGALSTAEGVLREQKAHYLQSTPWGTIGNHPGVFGKIGHAFGEIGNVAGDALVPNLMHDIPGTQANLNAKAAGGAKEEEQGTKLGQEATTTAATEAEVPEREATTEKTKQETKNLENPQLKTVQDQYSAAVQDAVKRGVDPNQDPKVKQLADTITSLQKESQPKTANDFEQFYSSWLKDNHYPDTSHNRALARAEWAKAEQAPQRPPQVMVITPSGQAEVARPGTQLAPGTQTVSGFATEGRPTTQMRNVAAQAQVAAQGIPDVINEITTLKDSLGPVAGRWNDFMQGKIGMDNPQFAGLRADLMMLSAAVALAHARGRLPENLREEFDRAINAPKQTPENLIATINHIKPWMERMGAMGNEPGGGGAPANTPSGGSLDDLVNKWKNSQVKH